MINLKHKSSGFTLVEILVSMTIFLSVSGLIIGTYNYVLRLNQRAQNIRLASDNARYLMEYLTREIRNGKIDYESGRSIYCDSTGGDIPVPSTYLPIVNIEGERECFYFGDIARNSNDAQGGGIAPTGGLDLSYEYMWVQKISGGVTLAPASLNDGGVKIKNLRFYVLPEDDPYNSVNPRQESVTITCQIVASIDPRNTITIPFQTTISLPLYDIQTS